MTHTRRNRAVLVVTIAALAASCGGGVTAGRTGAAARVGEAVKCGPLSYKVIEAAYRSEIPGAKQPAKGRVLAIRLNIHNASPAEVTVPALRLVGADGTPHPEFMEIEGSPEWLGMIRRVQPGLTEEGMIYFDVASGAYKLELVDQSNPESERVVHVELPAILEAPGRVDGPKMGY